MPNNGDEGCAGKRSRLHCDEERIVTGITCKKHLLLICFPDAIRCGVTVSAIMSRPFGDDEIARKLQLTAISFQSPCSKYVLMSQEPASGSVIENGNHR